MTLKLSSSTTRGSLSAPPHHRAPRAAATPTWALAIEHVGSTAVPGLAGKNVVDIDLTVTNPADEEAYVPALSSIGYILTVREQSWHQHRCLQLQSPRANVHVFGSDCPETIRHRMFRDWLSTHPGDRLHRAPRAHRYPRRRPRDGLQPPQVGSTYGKSTTTYSATQECCMRSRRFGLRSDLWCLTRRFRRRQHASSRATHTALATVHPRRVNKDPPAEWLCLL